MNAVVRVRTFHPILRALVLCAGVAAVASMPARADDTQLKREAIARLAASHDPAIVIGVGRVYLKQAGLLKARALLRERGTAAGLGREWGPEAQEWRAAQAELIGMVDTTIARRVEDPAWFRAAWGAAAAQILSAEEADEIASHFATEGGRQQRAVLELLLVGETLIAYYTFTERIRYDVPGSEREMTMLQKTWWVEDHRRVYDFTPYPNALRFASQDPGVKYAKMLAIQGIDAVNRHYDAVAADIALQLRDATAMVDRHVQRFRERSQHSD